MLTDAQAAILTRMASGATLTHSLLGERLWSLLEDPFTVFDDVSPRVLLASGTDARALSSYARLFGRNKVRFTKRPKRMPLRSTT